MTTQQTSIDAFITEKVSGRIAGRQLQVLRAVAACGQGTSAEILRAANLDANRNLMRARFTELAAAGRIVEAGRRKCRITGRSAIVWRLSTEPPRQVEKRKSPKLQIAEFCAWAHREIAYLRLLEDELPYEATVAISQRRKLEHALGFFEGR